MIGWRGRIGLITPASNTTIEYEYPKMTQNFISIIVLI